MPRAGLRELQMPEKPYGYISEDGAVRVTELSTNEIARELGQDCANRLRVNVVVTGPIATLVPAAE